MNTKTKPTQWPQTLMIYHFKPNNMNTSKFISKDCAQEIVALSNTEIVKVIMPFVELRKAGQNWVGTCPFCGNAKKKFSVSEKGFYKCFACQKGGKALSFIMDHRGLSYPEALRHLADQLNVIIY